jgi:O-antigen ligase
VWIEVLISSLQFATGSSLGLDFLGERDAVKTFDTPEGADPRAGGLMGHPNNLALYFVLMGPVLFAQVMDFKQKARWWLFWLATWVALNFGLLITFSRAGWLCAGASTLLVFHWFQRRAGRPLIVSIGIPVLSGLFTFVMLFALWDDFRYRITAPDYGSTSTRWQQFATALNVIRHRWWAGTGLGAYVQGAYEFNAGEGEYRNLLYRVHNGSLLVTAELGLLGGFAYHAWYWLVMKRGWRMVRTLQDSKLWPAAVGCFTGLLAWFVKSQYNVHTPIADVSLWHVAALIFVIANCAKLE